MAKFEEPGKDIEIYKDLNPAIKAALIGKDLPETQAKIDTINKMGHDRGVGENQATGDATQERIAGLYGRATGEANADNIMSSRQRTLNEFLSGMSVSERNFIEDVKTKGMAAALDMWGAQLNSATETMVNNTNNLATADEFGITKQFTQEQNALDRLMGRYNIDAQTKIANIQNKKEKKNAFGQMVGTGISLLSKVLPFLV